MGLMPVSVDIRLLLVTDVVPKGINVLVGESSRLEEGQLGGEAPLRVLIAVSRCPPGIEAPAPHQH